MNDRLANDLSSLRIERLAAPPRRRWPRVLAILALVSALGWAGLTYGRPYLESQVFKLEVAVTEISSISPAQASVDLTATGYVIPQTTAKIGTKIVGRISEVKMREGQRVSKGDVLFVLDETDQAAAISAARARANAAGAKVATIRAQRSELELEHGRQKKLVDAGAAPKGPMQDLEAKMKSLDTQIRAADAETYALGTEVESLKTGLKNLTISAPMDGTVVSKPAGIGDIASPGVALVELIDFQSLLVEADVSETRLSLVKPGGPCEITLDAIDKQSFDGVVVEVGPRLNRAKATATVKVRFVSMPPELRPEMSARVSFLQKALDEKARKAAPTLVVPATALVEKGGGKVVYVVEDGKVRLVPVTVGDAFGSGFVLESGPPSGTRVVKNPPASLADGQAIKEKSPT